MSVRHTLRCCYILTALLAVASGPGCGGGATEGNLPPQKPASQEDVQKADDQIKQNMGLMKKKK